MEAMLVEMPAMISDDNVMGWDDDTTASAEDIARVLKNDEFRLEQKKGGYSKYFSDHDSNHILVVNDTTGLVDVAVSYSFEKIGKNPAVSTYMIWAREGNTVPLEWTVKNLWMGLLDRYGTVLSDELHSNAGRTFWLKRLAECDKLGYGIGLQAAGNRRQNIPSKIQWKPIEMHVQDWLHDVRPWESSRKLLVISRLLPNR